MRTGSHEQTLIILKPDAIQRGLVGEILTRFEKKGLKFVAFKMAWPSRELASAHYDWSEEEKLGSGNRTIEGYKEKGIEAPYGGDAIKIAENTMRKLREYLSAGPVIAAVIEGAHSIAHVRKIRGATNPLNADIGSITADLSIDSYFISDEVDRATRNLVHASGTVEEAKREIALWFKEDEIHDYELPLEKVLYAKEWEDALRK